MLLQLLFKISKVLFLTKTNELYTENLNLNILTLKLKL